MNGGRITHQLDRHKVVYVALAIQLVRHAQRRSHRDGDRLVQQHAQAPDSGNYNDTVTFTNTTNGTGNTTRSVTLTVNNPNCATSMGTWQNAPFSPQSGVFSAEFDAVPNAMPIDAVTGLSASAAGRLSLAAIVRFNPTGQSTFATVESIQPPPPSPTRREPPITSDSWPTCQ